MYKGFIFKEYTRSGHQLTAAGFYSIKGRDTVNKLRKRLIEFNLYIGPDNKSIDYQMALYLKKICPENVLAIGVSMHVTGIQGPIGGIIGNPRREIEYADGISEDIGNGFSTAAFPGGPGIVVYGTPKKAENIIKYIRLGCGNIKTIYETMEAKVKNSIGNAIIITDGTGGDFPGFAALIYDNILEYMELNRE